MPVWAWIAVAVAVVVVAAVVAAAAAHRKRARRTSELRDHFGDEYDRTLKSAGGRRKGEDELERRLEHRRDLQIASVRDSERSAYDAEWRDVEAQFDETPLPAIGRADALVMKVLADLGYPMETGFDRRAALLSVDHPDAVEHYRRAHATFRRADDGGLSREDMFESLQHYRAFLDEVVGSDGGRPQRPPQDEAATEAGFAHDGPGRDSR
jgi:hypothetical protein